MKLGIAGTGMIVKDFLSVSDQIKGLLIGAILSTPKSEASARELAAQYGIEKVYTQYDQLLISDVDTIYVALPNHLHFPFAKEALEAGKHVIVEKPFTTNVSEALILSDLAREKGLFLIEAVTTLYLPNYKKIKEMLPELGDIKIVQCNFSQYSSRYDSFKQGMVLPAFDPCYSGGALMDINIYNLHYVTGLFGEPKGVEYYPNIERRIDTSGILILSYSGFQCTLTGAKDCSSPAVYRIQGDRGYLFQETTANVCGEINVVSNDGTRVVMNENHRNHRMLDEFTEFQEMIDNHRLLKCYDLLDHTLLVSKIQTEARKKAGIYFYGEKENL
jgi:predicted dehydrogenase